MKIIKFTNKYGLIVILGLTIVLFFRTCGMNVQHTNEIEKIEELNDNLNDKMDSISLILKINDINRQIEGLKNEHRMIQATDRRIIDYDRQTNIEKEIKVLKNKRKKIKK